MEAVEAENEALAIAGLHLDDSLSLKILDPDISTPTNQLRDGCKDFVDSKFVLKLVQHYYFLLQIFVILDSHYYIPEDIRIGEMNFSTEKRVAY